MFGGKGATVAEIRAQSDHYVAMAEQAHAKGDSRGVGAALRAALYFEREARIREQEDAEFDAVLAAAFTEPSGVRVAPGLESLRARIGRAS